jgi:hypothetical protein
MRKARTYGSPAKYSRSFPHLYWRHRGPWGRTGPTRNSILRKLNANLRYTECHNVDHDVWNRALLGQSWYRGCRRGGAPNRQKAKLALARLPRIIKIVA